ncbi:hypothetical protein AAC387_Pa09g0930 [Persea americana]
MSRYAFARVCVEVGIDAEFPTELRMKYKEKTIIQKVEYAWRPHPCKTCRTFTHGDNSCPLKGAQQKQKQVWVPKTPSSVGKSTTGVAAEVGVVAHVADGAHLQHEEVHCDIQQEERQCDLTMVEWTVVKGKPGSDRSISTVKSQSPCKRSTQMLHVEPNRFLSLSNLDGDSSVGAADLSATTALVLQQSGLEHRLSDTQVSRLVKVLLVHTLPLPLVLLMQN